MRDLHQAPKTVEVGRETVEFESAGLTFVLLHHRSGKTTEWQSLHVSATRLALERVTVFHFLKLLGFQEFLQCPITHDACRAIEVPIGFDFAGFLAAFASAVPEFLKSAALWQEGERPDDWLHVWGDGHTGHGASRLKTASDDAFTYAFTYLTTTEVAAAWTTHCHPLSDPIPEMAAAMRFVALKEYPECPEFDFERCHYRVTPRLQRPGTATGDNAADADARFDVFVRHLPDVLGALIAAHRLLSPFGLPLLTIRPVPPLAAAASRGTTSPTGPSHKYDIAISFAGEQRALAEQLAELVAAAGYVVFIDSAYKHYLWGKDLPVTLADIYREEARFCVILVSTEYSNKMWTAHERRHAIERWMRAPGAEYILPIRVDGSSLAGFPDTVGYLSLKEMGIAEIVAQLISKLKQARAPRLA